MSDERVEVETGASRRALFLGAGAAGATAILAACGTDGSDSGGVPSPPPATSGAGPTPGDPSPSGEDGGEGNGEDDGEVLLAADEVEVGSGVIISDQTIVVTQPSAGEFKGFSAACTHEGCIVSSVRDGVIFCGCHGSQYSIEDGSVQRAAPGLTPQTQNPLPAVEVREENGSIIRV